MFARTLERHGFECYRHGRLSLYALNTKSGEMVGKTAAHHTSHEFVAFLADLVANQIFFLPFSKYLYCWWSWNCLSRFHCATHALPLQTSRQNVLPVV
jgi:hypothetical protein